MNKVIPPTPTIVKQCLTAIVEDFTQPLCASNKIFMSNGCTISGFTNELNTMINNVNQFDSNIIILGDFNIDLLQIEEYTHFKDNFLNMVGNGLLPTITFPTRLGHTSASLIDNIFTNIFYNKDTSSSGILISDISDHLPFFSLSVLPFLNDCLVKV